MECLVVGAGAVGLAVARELALSGREVFVAEKNPAIGMETSSRNSEVIHAGLYYPTGTLKAALCVAGRDALYRYCADRAVPHARCGKLVVATADEQAAKLQAIHAQALANGCAEASLLPAAEACHLEPSLQCVGALHSPCTGIIDSHAYMLALQADAESAGAAFGFDTRLVGGEVRADGIAVHLRSGSGDEIEVLAGCVINCGGLWAPAAAGTIAGLDAPSIPVPRFAKGSYFSLAGKSPFSRLIYPLPDEGGLGVHLTLDLGGQARFGPDVEWLEASTPDALDYTVDPQRATGFYAAIRRYWPQLADGALQPAYAGVRPKLADGSASGDFCFANHGCARYLGLYGIESPGLTASLAIAAHVRALLDGAPRKVA